MLGAKAATFPMEQNLKLMADSGAPLSNTGWYCRLVGHLVYLTITRPKLSYSVYILSQFIQDPHQGHWDAFLRVLLYLKHSPDQGIMLSHPFS